MDKVNSIMNIMQSINYGFLDKNGNNIFDNEEVEYIFNSAYYLLSPEELLEKKVGVCWDQVELERKLFSEANIKIETYFIFIDDKKNLPSHTFLVYYTDNKVYWFEHSWYDEQGIHEYKSLNELLNDVEIKFRKSSENEVETGLDIHIYKYKKPNYNITCDQFYEYIYTQEEIYNYKLKKASIDDLDKLKYYKLKTIMDFSKYLSDKEMNKINNYINETISTFINQYSMIVYNKKNIGSVLIRKIEEGNLLDEIYIEKDYRNKKIGSSIIENCINNSNENIYLWVYKKNSKAIKLYKNFGFKVIDETDSRYYMEYSKTI